MDEQELSILYRPRINIERDYHSDGIIQHEPVQNIPEEVIEEQKLIPDIPTPLEQVATEARQTAAQLLRIRNITEVLPPPIQDTTQKLIDTVITTTLVDLIEVEDIEKEKKYDVYPSTEEEPDETETEPDDWPVMTSSDFTFVVEENKDVWDLAREQYLSDSIAMANMFSEAYNDKLQGYVYQLISAMDEIGLTDIAMLNQPYEGESVTGIPPNYQHLNDIIAREQEVLSDYADLFRKTHDSNATQTIFTAFDVISQERVRYLKEQYANKPADSYIDVYDRDYLADSRTEYERKYVAARTNVYKFLRSAVEMSAAMFDAHLRLAISKCSLLAKDVNIFAKKEYEVETVSNGTAMPVTGNTGNNTQQVSEQSKQNASGSVKQTGSNIQVTPIANKTAGQA